MSPVRPTLLLTRPKPQSLRFARALRAHLGADWPVIISPLAEIRFLAPSLAARKNDDLIFTSFNAVKAFAMANSAEGRKAWCVGAKTAQAAHRAGFSVVTGPGNAKDLAAAIIAAPHAPRMLYIRGGDIAFDMKKALESAEIETIEATFYEQVPIPPAKAALALMTQPGSVLLPIFSVQSARRIDQCFTQPVTEIDIVAISQAVAQASQIQRRRLVVAARPDAHHILMALEHLISAQDAP